MKAVGRDHIERKHIRICHIHTFCNSTCLPTWPRFNNLWNKYMCQTALYLVMMPRNTSVALHLTNCKWEPMKKASTHSFFLTTALVASHGDDTHCTVSHCRWMAGSDQLQLCALISNNRLWRWIITDTTWRELRGFIIFYKCTFHMKIHMKASKSKWTHWKESDF